MTLGQITGMTGNSKENLSAQKIKKTWEAKPEFASLLKTEEAVRAFIAEKPRLLVPGSNVDEVILELKKAKFIPPAEEKVDKKKKGEEKKNPEFIGIRHRESFGPNIVQDENLKKISEANILAEALENEKDIFKNDADLDIVHEQALSLGQGGFESRSFSDEYYYKFEGLVKGGRPEIQKDLGSLSDTQKKFRENDPSLSIEEVLKIEQVKKVSTIVERSIVYGVSHLKWYGDNIAIQPTSPFDDVKRGFDDVLELQGEESKFLGLGIDVTSRGLLSEQFRGKFDQLLKRIANNERNNIKYFTNHKGEPMKEFSVPKVILAFDRNDVNDLVYMVRNMDNSQIIETYKKHPLRLKIMNQVLVQCELLAAFAKEHGNPIYKMYQEVVTTIHTMSLHNESIKQVLNEQHDDEFAVHLKYLIREFKNRPINQN